MRNKDKPTFNRIYVASVLAAIGGIGLWYADQEFHIMDPMKGIASDVTDHIPALPHQRKFEDSVFPTPSTRRFVTSFDHSDTAATPSLQEPEQSQSSNEVAVLQDEIRKLQEQIDILESKPQPTPDTNTERLRNQVQGLQEQLDRTVKANSGIQKEAQDLSAQLNAVQTTATAYASQQEENIRILQDELDAKNSQLCFPGPGQVRPISTPAP